MPRPSATKPMLELMRVEALSNIAALRRLLQVQHELGVSLPSKML